MQYSPYPVRDSMVDSMSNNPSKDNIRRRWRAEREQLNASIPNGGVELTESVSYLKL